MVSKTPFYLLDTNTISYIVTGRSPEARMRYRHAEREEKIGVSAITEAEITYGLQKKPEAVRLHARMAEFLDRIKSYPWDSQAAQASGLLRVRTEAVGLTFGALDLLIAAHASALGATLVTHDRVLHKAADFVLIADWATDL